MRNKFKNWLSEIKKNKKSIIISIFFLIFALVLYGFSSDYLQDNGGKFIAVHDIILDHFGPYNLSFIYVWLFVLVITLFIVYPLIFKPGKFHYAINMFSLFIIVRSAFVLFTHLGTPIGAVTANFPGILSIFNSSNDLFFSGHTVLSFLGFFVFHENKFMKYFMLACSIILGVTVLLMHEHYSIDVFSAFFIAFGIYAIGNWFRV